MKVSVVIPAYNEERRIGACLSALSKQTVLPDEIIVVDNNSIDNTAAIAKTFPFVTVINEKKQGITPAREAGFVAATGDIIVRTDADAIAPADWIAKGLRHFHNGAQAVAGIVVYDYPNEDITYSVIDGYMRIMQTLIGHPVFIGPNMFVSKSALQDARQFICPNDSQVHEDVDLARALYKAHIPIVYDRTLKVVSSARRMTEKPQSFFIEYQVRIIRQIARYKIEDSKNMIATRLKRLDQKVHSR